VCATFRWKGRVSATVIKGYSIGALCHLRAYLMSEIRKFIKANDLTQMRSAKFFSVRQPKISYIMNGKIEKISSDYLVSLLAKTGGDFRYSFKQPTRKQAAERLSAQ
jgi:predicted XRE-type DNA-binding protein